MGVQTIVEPVVRGSGLVKVYHFKTVTSGDTFVYSTDTSAATPIWWIENTSTVDKVTATFSSGIFTFTLSGGAGTPNFDLFLLTAQAIQK